MPHSVKRRSTLSKNRFRAAFLPHRLFAGMAYRLQHWTITASKPLPKHILAGISPEDDNFKGLSFTFAVIALSAKIACVDGNVSKEKYIAFRDSFPLNGGVCGKIRALFTLACHNPIPLEHYVTQITTLFPRQNELFLALLERLFRIAAANGSLSHDAEKLLSTIAHKLNISPADYNKIYSQYAMHNMHAERVMGIDKNLKAIALKKRYHELMHRYHPDRFVGLDLSPEIRLLLQLKASEINDAYRTLSRG